MKFTYEVRPCRYDLDDETDEMITECLPEEAHFWSVFEQPAEIWVADFRHQAEAFKYAVMKGIQ